MVTKLMKLTVKNHQNRKTKTFDVTIPTDWEIVQAVPKIGLPEEYACVVDFPEDYAYDPDIAKAFPNHRFPKVAFLCVCSRKNKKLSHLGDIQISTNTAEEGIYRFTFGGWTESVFLKSIKFLFPLVKQIKENCLPKKAWAIFETGIGVN